MSWARIFILFFLIVSVVDTAAAPKIGPCEQALLNIRFYTEGKILAIFDILERKVAQLREKYPHSLELQKINENLYASLNKWDPEEKEQVRPLYNEIISIERSLLHLEATLQFNSQKMQAFQYEDVRKTPLFLAANHIYKVQTDRGNTIKVRFSKALVEEFFWESKNSILQEAAKKALEAVGRGLTNDQSLSSSGIYVMSYGSYRIAKIRIVGRSIGAIRVYGILQDGIYSFVHWEQSSEHDAEFLNKVGERTNNKYWRESWK